MSSRKRGGTNNLECHAELQIWALVLPPSAQETLLKEQRP